MEPKTLTSILPTVSVFPKLSASRDISDRIVRLVLAEIGAGREDEARAAVQAAVEAASWYVMTKVYEIPMPSFRGMISKEKPSSLRAAIENLVEMLPPSSHKPPFAQMKNLFCSGDPSFLGEEERFLEGFSEAEVDATLEEVWQKEDTWDESYGPDVVLGILRQWLSLMDELQQFLPPTKVPKDAERDFVGSLLDFWRGALGLAAKNTRIDGGQSGAFADFIRLAAEIIPSATVPTKPKNWDNQIRLVLEGSNPA